MNGIDQSRWQAVSTALDALLDSDPAQLQQRLAELQMNDPALGAQVGAVLAHRCAVEAEHFLQGSALDRVEAGMCAGQPEGRAERDASVDAFARDLRCYRNHHPVSARTDSVTDRLSRFVRRHRLGVAGGFALLLALLACIAMAS